MTSLIIEICNDSERISDWYMMHPFGLVTQADNDELADLIEQKIGTYILIQLEKRNPIDAEYIDQLRQVIEDWRV